MHSLYQRYSYFLLLAACASGPSTVALGQGILAALPASGQGIDSMLHVAEAPAGREPLAGHNFPKLDLQLPQLPDSVPSGHRFKTRGQVEVGGIQGPLPYSAAGTSQWNAYAKGEVGADLFGVPVKMLLDLGTDLPVRGQRNSVRFAFDAPRLMDKDKWGDASALHSLQSRLDSLENLRVQQYRKVKGAEDRLAHLQLPEVRQPELTSPQVDPLPISRPADPLDTLVATSPGIPCIKHPVSGSAKLDSLHGQLSLAKQRLDQLDALVTGQRMRVQRLTSTMNATKAEPGIIGRFVQGIKHLELGSCSPSSSEYLINGVNFQGVSFEYERKGIYLSFDKGRSFDDPWMDTDPVRERLRLLQQSLFFADARDLNPRKLTAVKVGLGGPEATHFHLGYLTGSRNDVPLGVSLPPGPSYTLHNHVVELDLGYAIKRTHLLRVIWARSVTGTGANGETGAPATQVGDLFDVKAGLNQAVKLGWSSNFERTGTRVEAELRSISPYFQSFGMGFVRNGSRAAELHLDQRLGRSLRVRGRYVLEDRAVPGDAPRQAMDIRRMQAMIMYRPTRSLTLRAGVMPVKVRTRLTEGGQWTSGNKMYSLGGDLRQRWKKTVALFSTDLGLYEWRTSEGNGSTVENHSVSLSILKGERWNFRVSWTGMTGPADSSSVPEDNFSLHAGYQARKGTLVNAGVQAPAVGRLGWSAEVRQTVGKRISVGLRGENFSRTDILFPQEIWPDRNNRYNWTLLTTLIW